MSGDQKNTAHENAIGWLILLAIMIVIAWLIWPMIDDPIKSAVRWVRWAEISLIALFVDDENYRIMWNGAPVSLQTVKDALPRLETQDMTAQHFHLMSMMAMQPVRWILIAILGLMGLWAYSYGPGTQYRRKLNLDGLIGVQARIFKVIAPFVKFNPARQPPRPPGSPVPAELPSFAEALGPEEWLAYNQIPIPDGKVDEQATYRAFAKQLGPRWQGAQSLPPYKQVLLAAFCLKAARKRREGDDMLGQIAECWSFEKGLDLKSKPKLVAEARRVLANKDIAGPVLKKCNFHAFQTTALLRGLQTAREEGGVLAPAQFVWLRAHDRTLWYPLNNLGRQGFHMEAIGAMAHFKAEKMTNRPIPRPKLADAVGSIVEYMNSARARPVPQLDYSGTKKRGIKKPKNSGIKKPAKKTAHKPASKAA